MIVNDTESVNEITAATEKASPSVVTISAASGNEAGTGSGVLLDDQGRPKPAFDAIAAALA